MLLCKRLTVGRFFRSRRERRLSLDKKKILLVISLLIYILMYAVLLYAEPHQSLTYKDFTIHNMSETRNIYNKFARITTS
jgi:hypothetical protein